MPALVRVALGAGLSAAGLLLLLSLVLSVHRIDGDSMLPALTSGSHVVVERLGSPPGGYAPGDLLAFRAPPGQGTPGSVLVKRVVGIAGDVVAIYEGAVYRNGILLEEHYLPDGELTMTRGAFLGEWLINEGQLFLLGDNRTPSLDSRSFGPVDADRVVGRVIFPVAGDHH